MPKIYTRNLVGQPVGASPVEPGGLVGLHLLASMARVTAVFRAQVVQPCGDLPVCNVAEKLHQHSAEGDIAVVAVVAGMGARIGVQGLEKIVAGSFQLETALQQ